MRLDARDVPVSVLLLYTDDRQSLWADGTYRLLAVDRATGAVRVDLVAGRRTWDAPAEDADAAPSSNDGEVVRLVPQVEGAVLQLTLEQTRTVDGAEAPPKLPTPRELVARDGRWVWSTTEEALRPAPRTP